MKKRNALIFIALVVVLGVVAVFLFSGGWALIGFRFEDEVAVHEEITEIRIVGGGDASIEIQSAAAARVDIYRKARYLFNRPGITHRIEGSVLYLDTAPDRFSTVSYRVTAPEGMQVSGELGTGSWQLSGVSTVDIRTSTGDIEVNTASGAVRLETSTGSIRAASIAGDLTAKTSVGSIGIHEVDGAVTARTSTGSIGITEAAAVHEARTSTGSISLEVREIHDHLEASTSTGSITLALPPDINARIEASTSVGSITVSTELPLDVVELTSRRLVGRLGEGTASIRLTTSTGSIDLKHLTPVDTVFSLFNRPLTTHFPARP